MDYQELIKTHPELFNNINAGLKIITNESEIDTWVEENQRNLRLEAKPESWAEIGVVFQDPYIVVLRDLVVFPDGKKGGYFRIINRADLQGGRGSAILPLFGKKILLLHQYRHATRSWHLEIPRGFGEPGMSSEENAVKEIVEEIQGKITEVIDLGGYHNNSGAEGNFLKLYLARISEYGPVNKSEAIKEVKEFSVNDFEELIENGEITDGFTIATFTRARLRGYI